MAAAAMAARAAMMHAGEGGHEERTDEELLAEALSEEARKSYNKHTDPEAYKGVVKMYVKFGNINAELITGKYEAYFNNFVLLCIIVAGVLVGMQTYEEFEDNAIVNYIDNVILYVFTVECMVKIFMEGTAPWRFFTGPEKNWNNFDIIVVILCYPFAQPLTGGNAAVLRLMRLARLMKLLKKIPQLQMIVMGLLGGLSSIVYIVILLLLVFYLYAIVGVMIFSKNDPWHFGTLHIAMLTLFRASTLEDWTDLMYISMFGCDEYQNVYCLKANPADCGNTPGMYQCVQFEQAEEDAASFSPTPAPTSALLYPSATPEALPGLSAVYWISFIVVSALVMLSLFIGAVTMSMSESMEDMKIEAEEAERKARLLKKQMRLKEVESKGDSTEAHENADMSTMSIREREEHKNQAIMRSLLLEAWSGTEVSGHVSSVYAKGLKGKYQQVAEKADELAKNTNFVNFITFIIILAGIMVGLQTWDEFADDPFLNIVDIIILAIFTFEVILKFVAEEFAPWNFFQSGWNTFDFVVVAGSFLPAAGSLVTMLRLLRLLRVLKLLKALPALAVIVNALIMGLSSIGFIGVILLLVFYLFAILGMILFKDNDPWHFGTLHTSILTLFRCSTLEDWTDVMYINVYGCKDYGYSSIGYDDDDVGCTQSAVQSWVAAMYFVIFTLLGALVLLTLFIGVVTTSMEEAQARQQVENEQEDRVQAFADCASLNAHTIENYRKVFAMLDVDNGGTIEEDELRAGLLSVGKDPSPEELQSYMHEVDEDDSGEIDLAEFIEFMTNMKEKKEAGVEVRPDSTPQREVRHEPHEHTPVEKFVIDEGDEEGGGWLEPPGKPAVKYLAPEEEEVEDLEGE